MIRFGWKDFEISVEYNGFREFLRFSSGKISDRWVWDGDIRFKGYLRIDCSGRCRYE